MGKKTVAQKERGRKITQQKQQVQAQKRAKRNQRWERWGQRIQNSVMQTAESVYGLTTGEGAQCSYRNGDGARCQSAARTGGYYCKAHTPKAVP